MPSKRILLINLLALAFLLPFSAPAMAAKIIPGSACKEAGIKQVYKKKTFTCIKLGKKMYWNNGVSTTTRPNAQKIIPATCVIQNFQTHSVSEFDAPSDGKVMFSADITNTSDLQVATQVKIYVEWYDIVGISFKKILQIPRIYPGQKIDFGSAESFQNQGVGQKYFPDEPLRINLRSSCGSTSLDPRELIGGKPPVLSGMAPVGVKEFLEIETSEIYVSTSLVITNIFEKDMVIPYEVNPESNKKVNIYGIFKDKFGNTIGGLTDYIQGEAQTLEKGETSRIDLPLLMFINPDKDFINRVATFSYTIVID